MRYFRVAERSMEPALHPGDFVVAAKGADIREGDIVIAKVGESLVVKRVKKIQRGTCWLEGDNREESCDSRQYGWVLREHVLGRAKVFHRPDWLTSGIL